MVDAVAALLPAAAVARHAAARPAAPAGRAVAGDRFEASARELEFHHRLSFLDERLRLEVGGRVSYSARTLDLEVRVEAADNGIEYNGRRYDVGRVEVKLHFSQVNFQAIDEPFAEEGDPLQMALELAQALNRIAGRKGRKRISLVFDSPRTFAKLFGVDGGRFMMQVISLVRLIEQTSDLVYGRDRGVDRYVVGIEDHVRRGVVRTLQCERLDCSGEIRVGGTDAAPRANAAAGAA